MKIKVVCLGTDGFVDSYIVPPGTDDVFPWEYDSGNGVVSPDGPFTDAVVRDIRAAIRRVAVDLAEVFKLDIEERV